MDYSVRTGPTDALTSTLREFADDRGGRGESERADGARAAADALERGECAAYFDRVIYGPGDPDRYSVRRLTRDEAERELREHVEGWEHHGRPARAAEAREALGALAHGAAEVRVGHLVYEIRD